MEGGQVKIIRTFTIVPLSFHRWVNFESSWTALGRKNMLRIEVYGSSGSAVFDLERPNEDMLYLSPDEPKYLGYRRVLLGPPHPYGDFMVYPAPGAGMGYGDSIVNEYYEFFNGIIMGKIPRLTFMMDIWQIRL